MTNQQSMATTTTSFPLTREQQGLWVEWKLSPSGASYNTCVQSILSGDLDVERFRQAIADVVATFELLRGYCVEDGDNVYIQLSEREFELPLIDVSEGAATETDAARRRAMALLNRRRDAAIDLTTFPLIRAALIRSAPQRYYFIGVVPHLISDGYSAVFILHAISIAYAKGRAGLADAFGEDRRDWSDYLALREEADPAAAPAASQHWQSVLADAAHITPICSKELSVTDTHGKRRHFELPSEISKRLRKLAFAQRTSLFSALAAIYAAFLNRYTGSEDIVVAFPVDLRPRGYREAFGFYVNVIPLRIDVSGNPSFAELIARIGKARRADKKHQHLPSLDIVKAKRAVDSTFDGRLTNVSMGQTVSRFEGLNLANVTCEPLDNELIEVRDDLSFMYEVTEGPIGIWLEYRESAFSDGEIDQMERHMLALITAMDAEPSAPINDIALMEQGEIDAVLNAGRGPSLSLTHSCPGAALSHSFNVHGEQPALLLDGDFEPVRYEQLQEITTVLGTLLPQHGGRVALLLRDRAWQIASIVSALTNGIAYVPIDPALPTRRIQAILDSAQPAAIYCDDEQLLEAIRCDDCERTLLPAFARRQSLVVAGEHRSPPTRTIDPASSAYVIFTSGSTGTPKGVEVTQDAVAHRLAWLSHTFSMQPGCRMLANTSYAFDVSVAEMLWPLVSGATLVLTDAARARDARYLRTRIADAKVDTLTIVPSALSALLEAPTPASLDSLRQVLAAGEALPQRLVSRFYAVASGDLYNVYGPTEATIYATADKCAPLDDIVTIGRAIANTHVVVVNAALAAQPFGVVGELCIGGPGLAKGYVGDAQLTDERFVDNPYGAGLLYRTGDLARLLPDGRIDYVGRIDAQVKLRGFRIELGDIATALHEHTSITDVAVLVQKHEHTGADQLVAYVTAHDDGSTSELSDELIAHARERLPDYMVPNRIVRLSHIPRLASGKLERAKLPAGIDTRSNTAGEKPTSPRQKLMAQAWAQTLNLPLNDIGLHSSFFELGGDSLMLISLACALEERGCFLEVHELFDHPTIALAEPLVRATSDLQIAQMPETGTYPTLPRQRKLLSDGFAKPAHWNRCIEVEFNRHLDIDALQQAYKAVVEHHDGLRISFDTKAQPPTFTYHPAERIDTQVCVTDLTEVDEAGRETEYKRLLNEANAGFDLATPPLIKLLVLDDETRSRVVLVCHHLLIDMRSCQVLLEDLMAGYTAALSRRPARMPARTSSLGAWSKRLHAEIDSLWHTDELPFWEEQLRDAAEPLVDRAHPANATEADMRSITASLSVSETSALTRLADASLGTGLHELSLTAFATAFAQATKRSRLVFNTCGVGRDKMFDDISLLRTVGEVNTVYPLAIELNSADLGSAVRQSLRSVPSRGLHYGMLRYIAAHESLTSRPEPKVFYNYVSRIDTALADTFGASVTLAPPSIQTSAPENRACYELYAEVSIQGGQLILDLSFDEHRIGAPVAEALLQHWHNCVRDSGNPSKLVDAETPAA
ncbi:MAG: amino acid adenylation domain-containing protein [Pseudomonadaceae bacterium]|nr:amino acid adenylation domain-containing protein [Pseudomonadaceae bacterium]